MWIPDEKNPQIPPHEGDLGGETGALEQPHPLDLGDHAPVARQTVTTGDLLGCSGWPEYIVMR